MERSKEPVLYMEDERSGRLVRVPEGNLEQYKSGQAAVQNGYRTPRPVIEQMLSRLRERS